MDYIIIASAGRVAAINPLSGNIKWKTRLKAAHKVHGDVTLLVEKDVIYAGCAGHLFCLDRHNGTIKWHNGLKGWGFSPISIANEFEVANARVRKSQDGM